VTRAEGKSPGSIDRDQPNGRGRHEAVYSKREQADEASPPDRFPAISGPMATDVADHVAFVVLFRQAVR
jgi:hypothetical protein